MVAINVATSVTYLGTTYEWADVVATSGFPYVDGFEVCSLPMKVLVISDGWMPWYCGLTGPEVYKGYNINVAVEYYVSFF